MSCLRRRARVVLPRISARAIRRALVLLAAGLVPGLAAAQASVAPCPVPRDSAGGTITWMGYMIDGALYPYARQLHVDGRVIPLDSIAARKAVDEREIARLEMVRIGQRDRPRGACADIPYVVITTYRGLLGDSLASRLAQTAPADSIVLRRTACFGACPVYRLRIARDGQLRFDATGQRAATSVATDSLSRWAFNRLLTDARQSGLWSLPDRIDGNVLCGAYVTDHPSLVFEVHGPVPKRVQYYEGCHGLEPLVHVRALALRELAGRMDSLARVERWLTPARGR